MDKVRMLSWKAMLCDIHEHIVTLKEFYEGFISSSINEIPMHNWHGCASLYIAGLSEHVKKVVSRY
jgi:hypothetical protein